MTVEIVSCSKCKVALSNDRDKIVCPSCHDEPGYVEGGIAIFHGSENKAGFFDKQAVERLAKKYAGYSYETFKESLQRRDLSNMDLLNKKVGLTRKLWWEAYVGKIERASVLEVGCGVNYLVPYWLASGNEVVAFDICKEAVVLLKQVIGQLGLDERRLTLLVGDAARLTFARPFDYINISNMLHHVADKRAVLAGLRKVLKDTGRMLIVEPNYYYPARWIVETDLLDPFNVVKRYMVQHDLIEAGEKAVIFSKLKTMLRETGFKIEVNFKDRNYIGYSLTYFVDRSRFLPRLLYAADRYVFSPLLPRVLAPFEYLIVSKA